MYKTYKSYDEIQIGDLVLFDSVRLRSKPYYTIVIDKFCPTKIGERFPKKWQLAISTNIYAAREMERGDINSWKFLVLDTSVTSPKLIILDQGYIWKTNKMPET